MCVHQTCVERAGIIVLCNRLISTSHFHFQCLANRTSYKEQAWPVVTFRLPDLRLFERKVGLW